MEFLDPIKERIRTSDDRELYTYFGIIAGIIGVLFGLLVYYHHSRVSWYRHQFEKLDKQRTQTRRILRDSKIVKAQQQLVEEILAQNRDFRIAQAYRAIIEQGNLSSKLTTISNPTTGEIVSDKAEVLITSTLRTMSMKEVTDFLMAIAQVPQLYTKEITIKKTVGHPTVDIDITVATLEPRSIE